MMMIMPNDYYHGSYATPCLKCGKLLTATRSPHYEPGMGYGVLTTYSPHDCIERAALGNESE